MHASKPKTGALFNPHIVDGLGGTNNQRGQLLEALGKKTISLPAKFFYDTLGSRLFEAITELDEYYLPRQIVFVEFGDGLKKSRPQGVVKKLCW